jgi:hypothetical protein
MAWRYLLVGSRSLRGPYQTVEDRLPVLLPQRHLHQADSAGRAAHEPGADLASVIIAVLRQTHLVIDRTRRAAWLLGPHCNTLRSRLMKSGVASSAHESSWRPRYFVTPIPHRVREISPGRYSVVSTNCVEDKCYVRIPTQELAWHEECFPPSRVLFTFHARQVASEKRSFRFLVILTNETRTNSAPPVCR